MENTKKVLAREGVQLYLHAWKDMWKMCPGFYGAIIAESIIQAVIPYATVFFSARIIEELAGLRRSEVLWKWVIVTIAIEGVLALFKAAAFQFRTMQQEVAEHRRMRLYTNKFLTMDFADVDRQEVQELYTRISQNEMWGDWGLVKLSENLRMLTKMVIGVISAMILSAGLFTAEMPQTANSFRILYHPAFAVLILFCMLMVSMIAGKLGGKSYSYNEKTAEITRQGNRLFGFYAFLGENKKRAADIRMYHQQKAVDKYLKFACIPYEKGGECYKVAHGPMGIYAGLSSAVSAIFTGIVYGFVCLKAWTGAFGIGAASQYIGAITALSQNVSDFFILLGEIKANVSYLKLTYEFLDIPNRMYQGSLTTEKRSDRKYEVEFKDVSFRYPGADQWVLRHVNIKFKVGSRLAVVGENGSGKTTFIKLLCRLYDPQEGQILLNGIDIKKYNYRDYQNIFSVVFQDFQLLSQSLGSNVAGSRNYDKEKVEKVLKDAGFGPRLATLSEGTESLLYKDFEESGIEISGGEAQKIAIARALHKNAPFLILDEPTAALDPIAEAEIYEQLNQIVGDKTAIYISHRLSSCRFCDEILVFDHGKIVEQGNHKTLVEYTDGKYRELWQAQAQYYI